MKYLSIMLTDAMYKKVINDKLDPSIPVQIVESIRHGKESRWIPVSERLPEIHRDVILSLRSLDIEIGFRAETEPYFYCHSADGCYIKLQNVIAWMPLPQPYSEVTE